MGNGGNGHIGYNIPDPYRFLTPVQGAKMGLTWPAPLGGNVAQHPIHHAEALHEKNAMLLIVLQGGQDQCCCPQPTKGCHASVWQMAQCCGRDLRLGMPQNVNTFQDGTAL